LQILVGSREQLARTVVEQRHLVIAITDPPPLGKEERPPRGSGPLLDGLVLAFADLDPADLQENWGALVPPYQRPAEELIMTRELGKKLWSFLLRRRDPAPELFVLQDDNERRGLSLAYAIADVPRLGRAQTIYKVQGEEWPARAEEVPPNRHVYEMTKRTRSTVI
jgi:hypothetical protein